MPKRMITYMGKRIQVNIKTEPDALGHGMYDYAYIPKKHGGGVVNLGVKMLKRRRADLHNDPFRL